MHCMNEWMKYISSNNRNAYVLCNTFSMHAHKDWSWHFRDKAFPRKIWNLSFRHYCCKLNAGNISMTLAQCKNTGHFRPMILLFLWTSLIENALRMQQLPNHQPWDIGLFHYEYRYISITPALVNISM